MASNPTASYRFIVAGWGRAFRWRGGKTSGSWAPTPLAVADSLPRAAVSIMSIIAVLGAIIRCRFARTWLAVVAVMAGGPAVIGGISTAEAQERFPSHYEWQRLETDEADILYPKGYERTAREVAGYLAETYSRLTVLFAWTPSRRVVVILSDGVDTHNGYATIFPAPTIEIDLAPPDRRSTIYSPDYLRQVLVHEFVHVLQLDQTDEVRGAFRAVFGVPFPVAGDPVSLLVALLTFPATTTLPPWFLEGGAQWGETEFGAWGRGRQALTWAMIRAAVIANARVEADEAVLVAPDWPYGTTAYLWGLAIVRQWQATHGATAGPPAAVLADHMRHMLPGFFEEATKQISPHGATDLWAAALDQIIADQRHIIDRLRHDGPTHGPSGRRFGDGDDDPPSGAEAEAEAEMRGERLTPSGMSAFGPIVSPDGRWVYFVGNPPDQRPALYRVELSRQSRSSMGHAVDSIASVERLGLRLTSDSRLWFDPHDPQRLFFTRLEPVGVAEWRTHLYTARIQHTADGTRDGPGGGRIADVRKITRGRLNEAAPHPAGRGWYVAHHPTTHGPVPAELRFVPAEQMPDFTTAPATTGFRWQAPPATTATAPMARGRTLLHRPTPLPDGSVLAVEVGAENWRIVRFRTDDFRSRDVVFHTDREILDLSWDAPAKRVWFVAGIGGILNLFSLDLGPLLAAHDGQSKWHEPPRPTRHTNALTGFLECAAGGDGSVVVVAIDHHGPHLLRFTAEQLPEKPTLRPAADGVPEWPWEDGAENGRPALLGAEAVMQAAMIRRDGPHDLFDGLTFQYWSPFVAVSSLDIFAVGVRVYFGDPLGRVDLSASAGWNWSLDRPFGHLQLNLRPADPELSVRGTFSTLGYSNRVIDVFGRRFHYYDDVATATLAVALPIRELDAGWRVRTALEWEHRAGVDHENRFGPGPFVSPAPFAGWRMSVALGIAFDSRTFFPRSVAFEQGAFGSATIRIRPAVLDQPEFETTVVAVAGASIGLGAHHVLTFHAAVGWGTGPRTLQGLFVAGDEAGAFAVRGYPYAHQVGSRALAGGVAWRFPLIEIYRGILTTPLYFRALALELFADMATAFERLDALSHRDLMTSIGAELQLQMAANGAAGFDIRLGYVYATQRPARDRHTIYFYFGVPLA